MERKGENINVLESFRSLEYDWDFNRAPPLSSNLIDAVKRIVYALKVQPEIMPTPRNSIQFEYISPDKDYLEIELFNSGLARAMHRPSDASIAATVQDIPFTLEGINKVVEDFYGTRI